MMRFASSLRSRSRLFRAARKRQTPKPEREADTDSGQLKLDL
jgi:hypothetical protein